jgi:ribonucleoside-diphosphate reductase alpha chain
MGRKTKVLVIGKDKVDMNVYRWDDSLFSDFLVREAAVAPEQAMDISRLLRTEIEQVEPGSSAMPDIDKALKAKLMEYGLNNTKSITLNRSFLVKNRLELSENARRVLERRYLKKDRNGKIIESPEKMFRRVASFIARAEKNYGSKKRVTEMEERFYNLMTEGRFLPNSPTLMNAGRQLGQLAACFVLPIEDSMDGIFDSLKNAAVIHKSGGGTGFSFSRLRPKNSTVGTTGGVASGPVSFMKIFNTATEQVKQGGTRRGANMAILRVDHPDIMEFIHCKKRNDDLNNFNISVALTDTFMKAVRNDKPYDLIDPRDGRKTTAASASEVYRELIEQAWDNGDPGVVFIDRINRDNPTPELGEIESTNPCGEQPLLPLEACNLGSINLAKFAAAEKGQPTVDWTALEETVATAVRFLDNTIDMSRYPLPAIDDMVKGNRKIGLGVMGWADLLFQMGIPYNSDKALQLAEQVMQFIQHSSHAASQGLAEERGPFKNFDRSVFAARKEPPRRNATTTTIAPTGTLSIIAGCSSGVEPLFALSFVRTVMDNDRLTEVNPHFEKAARDHGFYDEQMMSDVASKGSLRGMQRIPEAIQQVFVTAHDISPEWHVRMQAAFQKYTDNAVSKTVNLPKEASPEDVQRVYDLAFELGCKGVTIYRDGSKENQVLSLAAAKGKEDGFKTAVRERPEILEGFTSRLKTGMGNLYVTVTEFEGKPFEVFATIGKSGRSTTAKTEAIGRLVSLALRSGVKVDRVVNQLKGIGGEYPVFQKGGLVLSIPDAIARLLEKRYMTKPSNGNGGGNSLLGERCPECSQTISFEEGCMTCHFCGYTKCG